MNDYLNDYLKDAKLWLAEADAMNSAMTLHAIAAAAIAQAEAAQWQAQTAEWQAQTAVRQTIAMEQIAQVLGTIASAMGER